MHVKVESKIVYNFLLDHRIGGPHIYVDGLRDGVEDDLQFKIVTTGSGDMTEYALLNLRHIYRPLYVIEVFLNIIILLVWCLTNKMSYKKSIFAIHGTANIAPLFVARILKIPTVWHLHETMVSFDYFAKIGKVILRGVKHKIAVVAIKTAEVYQIDNPAFIPAFVDTDFWDAKNTTNSKDCGWIESVNGPVIRILVVGNLNYIKGVDILIDALSEFSRPFHLQVVGAKLETHEEYFELLKRKVDKNFTDKEQYVDFIGWQDKVEIRSLLASCDLFVLPSRSEACPIALLEAMAMNCRVVASDVGDIAYIMQDYTNGSVFSAGNVVECGMTINAQLEAEKSESAALGKIWSKTVVSKKIDKLYREIYA